MKNQLIISEYGGSGDELRPTQSYCHDQETLTIPGHVGSEDCSITPTLELGPKGDMLHDGATNSAQKYESAKTSNIQTPNHL